jgi:hypothetical protein
VKALLEFLRPRALPVALLLQAAWVCLAVLHFRAAQLDDAFITYRFARNIAGGLGFAYNPPQQVLGTTTPLYTLILAAAGRAGLDIPGMSLFINAASICGLALAMHLLGSGSRNQVSGWLAPALTVALPGTYTVLGMETLFYTMLIYAGFHLLQRERYALVTVLAALITLTRYDGLIFAAVVFLSLFLKSRSLPWRHALLYAALLLPWLVYAALTFGSVLPSTFLAKTGLHQAIFLEGLPAGLSALIFLRQAPGPLIVLLLAGLVAAGAAEPASGRGLRWAFLWMLLYGTGYALLGLRYAQHWYYYPVIPALLLLAVSGVSHLGRLLGDRLGPTGARWSWLAARGLAVIGLVPISGAVVLGMLTLWGTAGRLVELGGRYPVYREAAAWVCANTEMEASIAVPEIGIVGWFCGHRIIDPYGLVTPEMVPYIRAEDRLAGLATLRPQIIIIQNYPRETTIVFPDSDAFGDEYHPVKAIQGPDYPYVLVIFARQP